MRAVAVMAVAAVALAPAASGSRGGFSARVDNRFFPLVPGATNIYEGHKDGKRARDVFHVTSRTATVDGAQCRVVDDRLYLNGTLVERTTDWYAQDVHGTVWYFGESTREVTGHGVTTEGSWRAGANGARPGIFMPANPRVGQTFEQEHAKGIAEDHFRIVAVSRGGKATVETREWTPLEPGVVDHKLYVKGIGTVLEQAVKGDDERDSLVAVTRRSG